MLIVTLFSLGAMYLFIQYIVDNPTTSEQGPPLEGPTLFVNEALLKQLNEDEDEDTGDISDLDFSDFEDDTDFSRVIHHTEYKYTEPLVLRGDIPPVFSAEDIFN